MHILRASPAARGRRARSRAGAGVGTPTNAEPFHRARFAEVVPTRNDLPSFVRADPETHEAKLTLCASRPSRACARAPAPRARLSGACACRGASGLGVPPSLSRQNSSNRDLLDPAKPHSPWNWSGDSGSRRSSKVEGASAGSRPPKPCDPAVSAQSDWLVMPLGEDSSGRPAPPAEPLPEDEPLGAGTSAWHSRIRPGATRLTLENGQFRDEAGRVDFRSFCECMLPPECEPGLAERVAAYMSSSFV